MKNYDLFLLIIPLMFASACTTTKARVYDPIAQHTLKIVDAETDVVWVKEFDSQTLKTRLLRCSNTEEGPKCEEVKQPS